MSELYKDWTIEFNPKPIPPRFGMDYDVTHNDYDGEDVDLFFMCGSVEGAKKEIDSIEEYGDAFEALINPNLDFMDKVFGENK